MEKGIIRLYNKNGGTGMIGRSDNVDLTFNSSSIVGRDRNGLKQGDSVWFEVENVNNLHVAINIRKC